MTERFDRAREEVRIDDPQLSPEANRLLTEELRDGRGCCRRSPSWSPPWRPA
jgi:hypothetical protein